MSVATRIRSFFGGASPNGRDKNLTVLPHDGRPLAGVDMLLPATKVDYAKKVGTGLGSSVLAAPLNWLMRNFAQAPPFVERWGSTDAQWRLIEHGLEELLLRPNPFYGGRELWMATVLDFAFGNAYWIKLRNSQKQLVQLWWVPSFTIAPRWPTNGSVYISHYDYHPSGVANAALGFESNMTVMQRMGGRPTRLEVEDVVHLRFGLDPRNTRLGLSQLGALLREVATDDEASNFASAILQNLGVIGVVLAPKEKGTATRDDVERVKAYIKERFTGDRRGEALALGQPTDVTLMQYNLQAFDMSPLRDVSEERVCAALGIPAAVVGFGTGLQATKVGATMREMRRMAWTDCVIPMQDAIAEQVGRQLLSEFGTTAKAASDRVTFDRSRVPALMEDEAERRARVRADYLAGMITRAVAKREVGYAVASDGTDDIYAQPANVIQLRPGETQPAGAGTSRGSEREGTDDGED